MHARRPVVRALFVNSGLLGQQTFATFVRTAFAEPRDGVAVTQTVLAEGLTRGDRVMRRLLCARLWPRGFLGMRNIDWHRFRCEMNAGLLARRRIRALERDAGAFDALYFHHHTTAYASIARMRRTPSIVSIDTTQRIMVDGARTDLERRSYRPGLQRDGQIFRAARLIISTSRWAERGVRAEYPDCTTEILVLPPPVRLAPDSAEWIEERFRRAQAPGYKPRVLFVGGDFSRKGGVQLLDVWRDRRLHERASLDLMTGWDIGPLPPGVTQHRGLTAYTPGWLALWRSADLFVLPTLEEAFGLVFQEAAAAGLPSIGTRLSAIPEVIDDGATGHLVPPGDREALAVALDAMLASPDRRRAMGTRARAFIAATADVERYVARLASEIRRVASV